MFLYSSFVMDTLIHSVFGDIDFSFMYEINSDEEFHIVMGSIFCAFASACGFDDYLED